jgi:two-component system, chemotaxis family, sensor kinase CheA
LALLDAALLQLEETGALPDEERTSLLRALHTLKGNSGMLGLHVVVDAVHALETQMKEARSRWPREVVDRFFEVAAALRRVTDRIGTAEHDKALERLANIELRSDSPKPETSADPDTAPRTEPVDRRADTTRRRGAEAEVEGNVTPTESAAPLDPGLQPTSESGESAEVETGAGEVLRVPFEKLDALLNQVGELVAVGAAVEALLDKFRQQLDEAGARRPLEAQVEALELITESLRDATMNLRTVPVARVFQRFPSLARDLARAQGKQVRVVLEGEQVELDKSTVDALADPLLHLIRNAVDHGIGTPEERTKQGRPETGTITLRAARIGDRVLVEVSDDGAGLDRKAILERARQEGLLDDQENLSPTEIDELIFRPGFSTRSEATTVSGRGVGLEVVRRRVNSLRGLLTVGDAPGGGTRFVLALPLTLAIVPALIFEAEGETLALPASEVQETLRRVNLERAGGAEVVRHRDHLIPVARASRLLGFSDEVRGVSSSGASFAIVLRRGNRSAAILADRLLEQRDIVVRALPRTLGTVRGVSGATVTPSGNVVLLLDSGGLLDMNLDFHRREARAG